MSGASRCVAVVLGLAILATGCSPTMRSQGAGERADEKRASDSEAALGDLVKSYGEGGARDAFVPLKSYRYLEAPTNLERWVQESLYEDDLLAWGVEDLAMATVTRDGRPAAIVASVVVSAEARISGEVKDALTKVVTGDGEPAEKFDLSGRSAYLSQDNSGLRVVLFQKDWLYVFAFGENGDDVIDVARELSQAQGEAPVEEFAEATPGTTVDAASVFMAVPGYTLVPVKPRIEDKVESDLRADPASAEAFLEAEMRVVVSGRRPVAAFASTSVDPAFASFPDFRRVLVKSLARGVSGSSDVERVRLSGRSAWMIDDDKQVAVGFWHEGSVAALMVGKAKDREAILRFAKAILKRTVVGNPVTL